MILLKIYWRTKAAIKKLCFKIMFGKRFSVGKNTTFRKNFGLYLEKGASIKIGHDCFFNRGCSVNCLESVEIGNHTIFGENVKIYDQNHKFRDRTKLISEQGYSTGRVKLEITVGFAPMQSFSKALKSGITALSVQVVLFIMTFPQILL